MVDSIRINAGGGAIGIYGADAYYSGGQSASSNAPVDSKGVYYPANQEVYQTERYGTFTYTFTDLVPNAIHTVLSSSTLTNTSGTRLASANLTQRLTAAKSYGIMTFSPKLAVLIRRSLKNFW